ncbi:NADP-dependent 3-hydroxy acid dehydrogenase YdfG [Thalassocella blandensis]|nr:NADP-dependent 3-hydroxy acid dehydrogenase YdfG [Thalassocella blandensis]
MAEVICITGATSGFGLACARKFANDNDVELLLIGRREERLQQLVQSLPGKVQTFSFDVRNAEAIDQFARTLTDSNTQVDVLINNAGLALGTEPADQASLEDWNTMVDTNIKGLMHMTHALLPQMVDRNKGHIINLGSIAGSWPYPGGNAYCATKAFVEQFSRCLRADLLGKHIRVSNIAPGLAETEFSLVRMKGDKAKADALYNDTQALTPEDIAEIIYWTVKLPAHININHLEVMPTCQAWGPLNIDKTMV